MKNKDLGYHICRVILGSVGIIPGEQLGQYGISRPEHLLKATLDLVYDTETESVTVNSPVFAGEILIENTTVRGLFSDLSVQDQTEFLFVFRNESKPIYGIRFVHNNVEETFFRIGGEIGWVPATMIAQCRALMAMDLIATHGLIWKPCAQYDDLFQALTTFATLET